MRDWRNWIAPAAILGTLIAALFVAVLVALSLASMRDRANQIDETRSVDAATAALIAVRGRLSGTVEDNAIWREAFDAMAASDRDQWVHDNWGAVSSDYKLYDGVIVSRADGTTIAAYLKGAPFDPTELLDNGLRKQIVVDAIPDRAPLTGIYNVAGAPAIVASHAVQNARGMPPARRGHVLSMLKFLSPKMIDTIAADYMLPGLHVTMDGPLKGERSIPLMDGNGRKLGDLAWPNRNLGNQLYESSQLTLRFAFALMGVLFITGTAAGYFEIKALRRFAATADRDARHDPLSGLLNRNGMIRALQTGVANSPKGKSAALLLVDLDGFKAVNDTWGHLVGDALIRHVARRLVACHPGLDFVARFGGDEFALAVAAGTDPRDVADAVLQALAEPFTLADKTVEVGASIGYAAHEPGINVLELIRRADMALYDVKAKGGGRALAYSKALDQDREALAALEENLRRALNEDQLSVAFQPVIAAETGLPSGVEVLARWLTPEGSISPELFIPVAEKSGLIFQLGATVLRKAIRFAAERPGIEIAVNVSPTQLCAADFADTVAATLKEENFDPRRLVLEVTEGVLFDSPLQAGRAIETLHAIGIRFALDDFGAGYASIGTLRSFKFDRLKLDRSLLNGLESKSGRSVFGATVALADALSIPVVVEGVETAEQARHVRELGCRYMQGYYFGRPMAARDFDNAFTAAAKAV